MYQVNSGVEKGGFLDGCLMDFHEITGYLGAKLQIFGIRRAGFDASCCFQAVCVSKRMMKAEGLRLAAKRLKMLKRRTLFVRRLTQMKSGYGQQDYGRRDHWGQMLKC